MRPGVGHAFDFPHQIRSALGSSLGLPVALAGRLIELIMPQPLGDSERHLGVTASSDAVFATMSLGSGLAFVSLGNVINGFPCSFWRLTTSGKQVWSSGSGK